MAGSEKKPLDQQPAALSESDLDAAAGGLSFQSIKTSTVLDNVETSVRKAGGRVMGTANTSIRENGERVMGIRKVGIRK